MQRGMIRAILQRALKRRPPARPTLAYVWWQYVANARRTLSARMNRISYPGVPPIAAELAAEGIVSGPNSRFLTREGQAALAEASASVLRIANSTEVQAMVAAGCGQARAKDYLVPLIDEEQEHAADSPLLRVAL